MAFQDFSIQQVFKNSHIRVICFSFLLSSLGATLRSLFPGLLGILCQFIIMLILGAYWLVTLLLVVAAAFSKHWASSGLRALSLAASMPLAFVGLKSGDYVHLFMLSPYYLSAISKNTERPVRFYWGDEALMIWDGFQLRTLVYDDRGKSTEELSKELDTERRKEGLSSETTRLFGNFFVEHARYAND